MSARARIRGTRKLIDPGYVSSPVADTGDSWLRCLKGSAGENVRTLPARTKDFSVARANGCSWCTQVTAT